jgi:hypothetical protein
MRLVFWELIGTVMPALQLYMIMDIISWILNEYLFVLLDFITRGPTLS